MNWLEKKLELLQSFDGSLLGYVNSSTGVTQLASKLGICSSQILKLDANENFFVDSSFLKGVFLEVIKNVDLRFYDSNAMVELKTALGKYVGVPSECVVACSGSEQLIDFIIQLFLEKGDEAISISPSFFMYKKRVELSGAKLVSVPLRDDLSIDVDDVLKKVTNKTKLIFVCSPNNPTGNQFDWAAIEALANASSAVVLVDEAYVEFGTYSVCPLAINKKNIVVVRTFSKAFGLAGLRFGYATAHKDFASVLSETLPYTVSTLTARYVQRLLDNIEVVQRWTNLVNTERERLLSKLRVINGIKVLDSKANFVTFKTNKNTEEVYRELLDKGIIIKNLGELPVIGHCLRVTIGLPNMNDRFLKAMPEILV
ncbi:MAG: histidinol-phosphate transaminase [Candidatus Bathyarchaeota archaeon]|nr:histidinol-phosphate transaminase [Candidatus Bathyarchaeum sp.]